jgi:hypothetical protein
MRRNLKQNLRAALRPTVRCHSKPLQRSDVAGAPECSPSKPRGKVTQTIDTWSLGCLLSIAATWVVLGFQGLMQFEFHRVEARAEALKKRAKVNTVKFAGSRDAFHDEEKVLDAITIWHEYVKGQTRKSDTITPAILDLVDGSMLLRGPNERLSMSRLCDMLLEITRTAEKESATILQPHESVLRSLQQTDRKASVEPLHKALAKLRERLESGQKPSSMVTLMKTSHRSRSFSSTGAGSSPRQSRQIQIDSAAASLPPVIPESRESSPLAQQAIHPSAGRSSTAATNSSINHVSIREQIDAHKAQRGVRRLLSTLKTKPDPELNTWLKGRDIVCSIHH